MITKSDLIKVNDYLWEIPKSIRSDMRVPALIYASDDLIEELLRDRTTSQIMNVATLPGIEKAAIAYKDVDMVVDTVHQAGLAVKVAKLRPVGVIKG